MNIKTLIVVGVFFSLSTVYAIDFTSYSDLAFAERYAFSMNREALISELKKDSGPWYFYMLLNLQTEGKYDKAREFIDNTSCNTLEMRQARQELWLRQKFFNWEASLSRPPTTFNTPDECLALELGMPKDYVRIVPIKPDTYPSTLDPKKIDFAAFKQYAHDDSNYYEESFRPIFFPDYLKTHLSKSEYYRWLSIDELAAIKTNDETYVAAVLDKLDRGPEEDVERDSNAARAVLDRKLSFLRSCGSAQQKRIVKVIGEILELERARGNFKEKKLFKEYLGATIGDIIKQHPSSISALEKAYLAAYRSQGEDLKEYLKWFDGRALAKIRAEVDLLAGAAPAEAEVAALTESEYQELSKRVEIKWSAKNPRHFAEDDAVALELDVKNVKTLRLAIYELDAFEALVKQGADVTGAIDLDGCVPTVERSFDYSAHSALRRHHETIELPELKQRGLYVVECSGSGLSSRALVRKGALRIGERLSAGGTVFTVLDEKGNQFKDAKLRIGATTFAADESGEIVVPFAVAKETGKKTVVIGAGGLAVCHDFTQKEEAYVLQLDAALPMEAVVAGTTAKAVLKPLFTVAGMPIPLSLLEKPSIKITLVDFDGVEAVRTIPCKELQDNAELVVPFVVPARLRSVKFTLAGKVRNISEEKEVPLIASRSIYLGSRPTSGAKAIAQALLRRGAEGYLLELRGLNGEALAAREISLQFKHRVFLSPITERLQTDTNGVVRLGALTDIVQLKLQAPFRESWDLDHASLVALPSVINAVEGERIEFAVRALMEGAWPGAEKLKNRVRLVRKNHKDQITVDCTRAVSYKDGILAIEPLVAGDYALLICTENRMIELHITPTAAKEIAGGLIVGEHRGLADLGSPSCLRIEEAKIDEKGVLAVRLAAAGEGARVHLVARRYISSHGESDDLLKMLTRDVSRESAIEFAWTPPQTEYISERDLGDKLRYILDRRNLSHRPGNMLERPSLILNPWSRKETATNEETVRAGEDWNAAAPSNDFSGNRYLSGGSANGGYGGISSNVRPMLDFLGFPAEVWCNLRPNEDGIVEFKLANSAEYQDFEVIAVDERGVDSLRLFSSIAEPTKKDIRYFAAKGDESVPPRTKAYSTVKELLAFLGDNACHDFAFLGDWAILSDAEKRELYGKRASHELDLFLYFKDRQFFDAVIAPNLKNKRVKRFTDRWLLGEDLSEYAQVFQSLNALEKCLLAMRDPKWAQMTLDALASDLAAHPIDPATEDRLLSEALGLGAELGSDSGGFGMMQSPRAPRIEAMSPVAGVASQDFKPELEERKEIIDDISEDWSNQAVMLSAKRASMLKGAMRRRANASGGKQKELARREARALYRPPARTREWLETDHFELMRKEEYPNLVANNPFWTALAHAIVEGRADTFRDTSVMFVKDEGLTAVMGALALLELSEPVVFTERRVNLDDPDYNELGIVQRYFDPALDHEGPNGSVQHTYGVEEFVVGRPYALSTVLSNPTDRQLMTRVKIAIPDGALPLGYDCAEKTTSITLADCSMNSRTTYFYFPTAEGLEGKVVPVATKVDKTSWEWISQNGTDDEVLAFLKAANLSSPTIDLDLLGWRMTNNEFAEKVYELLSERGIYHDGLWRVALKRRDALTKNRQRVREILMQPTNLKDLARRVGPYFHSPLVDITPEESGLYEHKEYWPLVNARFHSMGGQATIANEALKNQYRAFLDILALKKELSADDRLEAAVYLIAQDRVDEAEALVKGIELKDVATKMQLDYLRAYFAFSALKPEEGRKIAVKYSDYPVPRWRDRFRKVVEQADEIAGRGKAFDKHGRDVVSEAPSIELSRLDVDMLIVKARNVKKAIIRAYPTDLEVMFSKDPFGGAMVKASSSFLKPAWTEEIALNENGTASVVLPEQLKGVNVIVEAKDAEGRAYASETMLSGALDVQVAKEYGELRVRDAAGNAIPAAYVKVYARDANGEQVKFYKDGYTDLRGAFDYAGVSTDSDFRPKEFAILVFHDTKGAKVLRAPHP